MPKPYSLDLRATYSRQKSVKTTSLTQGTTKNNRPKQFVIRSNYLISPFCRIDGVIRLMLSVGVFGYSGCFVREN